MQNINDVFKSKEMSIETAELKGYKLIEEIFCDNSRLGAENEPASTQGQLMEKLADLLEKRKTVYTCLTSIGQFQVYLGVFEKLPIKEKKSTVIDRNTIQVDLAGNHRIIRLYDTNIVELKGKNLILFTGGHNTQTTRDRMNKFTPQGVRVFQKNWETFVEYNGKITPFVDHEAIIKL